MEPDHGVMDKKQIRVEGKIYSAEKLAELHPGGPLFIQVNCTYLILETTETLMRLS